MQENELIDGLLIGDSYMRCRSRISAGFGHNCKEESYTLWVREQFRELGFKTSKIYVKPNGYNTGFTYQFQTEDSSKLLSIYKRWYGKGKKALPDNFKITPYSTLLWYVADGGLCQVKGYLQQISFAAMSFPVEEREILVNQLRTEGFKSRQGYNSGKIFISKKSIPLFLEWIGSCPFPCYQYKWDIKRFTNKAPKYKKITLMDNQQLSS